LMEGIQHDNKESPTSNTSLASSKWWHDPSSAQIPTQVYGRLLSQHRTMKAQSFDIKMQPEGTRGRQLKTFLQKHHIARKMLQSDSRGHIYVIERRELHILNPAQMLLSAPASSARVRRPSSERHSLVWQEAS
jgi:hypothetical protein